jgi:hypothetical protein
VRKSEGDVPARSHRFGFAEMLRDVLLASMERGEFPHAMSGLIAILIVLRLPAEVMSTLIVKLLESLERRCIWGYVAAAILAVSWMLGRRQHRVPPDAAKLD